MDKKEMLAKAAKCRKDAETYLANYHRLMGAALAFEEASTDTPEPAEKET